MKLRELMPGIIGALVATAMLCGAMACNRPKMHVSLLVNGIEVEEYDCNFKRGDCLDALSGHIAEFRDRLEPGDVVTAIVGAGDFVVASTVAGPMEEN